MIENVAGSRPEDVGMSSERLGRIGPWMRNQVASGRLTGLSVAVMRRDKVVWWGCHGQADVARARDVAPDTIFRIYSMTKPLASLALMMLYEEGKFQLDDPISRYLPAFERSSVFAGGGYGSVQIVPAERGINFRDLLTHTSGLTYGFMQATPVDALYRAKGIDYQTGEGTLAEITDRAAAQPLLAHPGTRWNYSISTDVVGRLVEVISGQPFDRFLTDRILAPLGMRETAFHVTADKVGRFAACYMRGEDGRPTLIDDPEKSRYLTPPLAPSGGGGLVSTTADYLQFCRLMLGKGALGDVRLIGRKTAEYMTTNHLPGDLAAMGTPRFAETPFTGIGFGLGFSVVLDPAKSCTLSSAGEYAWGGMASTAFWCDPQEDLAVVLMTQLVPSSAWPIRRELRVLVNQSIVD